MAVVFDKEKLLNCYNYQPIGFLIGLTQAQKDANKTIIIGYCSLQRSRDAKCFDWSEGNEFVLRHYPAGCRIVGCYYGDTSKGEGLSKEELKMSMLNSKLDQVQFLALIDSEQVEMFQLTSDKELVHCSVDCTKTVTEYLEKIVLFRLQTTFEINLPKKYETILPRLKEATSGCVLWLPQQQILLNEQSEDQPYKSVNKSDNKIPVKMELLQKPTSSSEVHPLTITVTTLTLPTVTLPIHIDVIGTFMIGVTLNEINDEMGKGLEAQMNFISDIVNERGEYCTVSIHHFLIPSSHLPLTVFYPHLSLSGHAPHSALLKTREKLHERFCLPMTRPFLRKQNREWSPWKQESLLIDPHLLLKLVPDSSGVAMVTGSYAYYHYLQDKFNDNGWGCAYRSLQTLWSWFQYQGYTEETVPSHHKIQQTLVDCGDKPKSFIGSTQWIGSIEVSTVLNHLLQIDSRIQHYSSGAELADSGRVLQQHFRTQGTPVMIGGGVLAHTILGVNYNENTSEIKFLILDPHYVGQDDIKLIHGKGCGWKAMNFWDQTASYNMCMPLRPQEI